MSQPGNGLAAVEHSSSALDLPTSSKHYHRSTLAMHADDDLNRTSDVSPALHVSTTFRYDSDPDNLVPATDLTVSMLLKCSSLASILSLR